MAKNDLVKACARTFGKPERGLRARHAPEPRYLLRAGRQSTPPAWGAFRTLEDRARQASPLQAERAKVRPRSRRAPPPAPLARAHRALAGGEGARGADGEDRSGRRAARALRRGRAGRHRQARGGRERARARGLDAGRVDRRGEAEGRRERPSAEGDARRAGGPAAGSSSAAPPAEPIRRARSASRSAAPARPCSSRAASSGSWPCARRRARSARPAWIRPTSSRTKSAYFRERGRSPGSPTSASGSASSGRDRHRARAHVGAGENKKTAPPRLRRAGSASEARCEDRPGTCRSASRSRRLVPVHPGSREPTGTLVTEVPPRRARRAATAAIRARIRFRPPPPWRTTTPI